MVRYMKQEGAHIEDLMTLVDIDIVIKVFIKKSINQMSINRRRTMKTQGAHVRLVRILSFLLFIYW